MLTIASRLDVMNRLGRAMADPTRSRILLSLLDAPGYPAQLAESLGLTRTNVSNHLACLRDCGIVVAEPEGRRTRYEIVDTHLARALNALVETTLAVDENAECKRARTQFRIYVCVHHCSRAGSGRCPGSRVRRIRHFTQDRTATDTLPTVHCLHERTCRQLSCEPL